MMQPADPRRGAPRAARPERKRLATALLAAPLVLGLPMLFAKGTPGPSLVALDLIILFFALPFAAGTALLWHSRK